MMVALIFLTGALLGLVIGAAACVRLVRQELTDHLGPRMELIQLQLGNLQAGVNLALANWHAELHSPTPPPGASNGRASAGAQSREWSR